MTIYTDDVAGAYALLSADRLGPVRPVPMPEHERGGADPDLLPLLRAVFDGARELNRADPTGATDEGDALAGWRAVLVRDHATGSQYDLLADLIRSGAAVPDGVVCLARTGSGMHGFRGRPWSAHAGNIHLVVHLAPGRAIDRFDSALTAMAAVSAAEAAESVLGGEAARIKWVNDVIVGGAKVGGVLAWTQTRDVVVSNIVLGIGLNVEVTPIVERSPYVPEASSLRAAGGDHISVPPVLHALLSALRRNYDTLLHAGAAPLLDEYRRRSSVVGEYVEVVSDDVAGNVIAKGRVTGIGDGLELFLDSSSAPVTRGRLLTRPGEPG